MVNPLKYYWNSGPLVLATAAFTFSLTALAAKLAGQLIPPFETVSGSGVLCLIALSALLTQRGQPLVPRRRRPGSELAAPLLHDTSTHDPDPSAYAPPPPGSVAVTLDSPRSRASSSPPGPSVARIMTLTVLRGAFGASATTCFYLSLQHLALPDAVSLFFMSPVIATFLEWVVIGNAPGWGGAAATTLTLGGAVLVTQPPFLFGHHGESVNHPPPSALVLGLPLLAPHRHAWLSAPAPGAEGSAALLGSILAVAAAACNASGFLCVCLLQGRQPPLVLTWWYNLVLAVATGIPLILGFPAGPVAPTPHAALLVGAVAATQFCAQLCLNRGFQLEPPGRGAAINVLQVVFSFAFDIILLGDMPSLLSIGGAGLVASGVLCVALSPRRPAKGAAGAGADDATVRSIVGVPAPGADSVFADYSAFEAAEAFAADAGYQAGVHVAAQVGEQREKRRAAGFPIDEFGPDDG
ncbi:hypothetical protein HYH03_016868 [Edaphochlamys debaryana]|uniref:EamA domain-containing protein n=1 Tax=Edaphochlamys debaryana TaxID=47281 RepID=A0A835XLA1_9CHLO|nr:hypothetical protein HYH03_016868 [Edaphochlamys debaryana]|eukprot:KAG2484326.1 hypothetical protein HYH03_016868 [Edaphochlamys debaryana]